MKHTITDANTITLELSIQEFAAISDAVCIVGKAHVELDTEPPILRQVAKGLTEAAVSLVTKKLESLFQE